MPLGTAGKATLLLENENDFLAALMMMKRGIKPLVYGKRSLRKKLMPWAAGCTLKELKKPFGWAVVSGVTDLEEFTEMQKQYNQPLFAPLIGLSKKQINELKRKFK